MTTRAHVDPELLPLLETLPSLEMSDEALSAVRLAFDNMHMELPDPDPAGVWHSAPGRDGQPDVPLLVYTPAGQRLRPAILHIHGGGMVIGSAAMSKVNASAMAVAQDAVVVSVDYRLSPEVPFPGPQEDCYAALSWLIANAATLGIDPARIVVTGESAGGGLAAALAHMVRDRGEYRIAGQLLIYPMLDHRTGGADDAYCNPTTGEFVWTREANRYGWAALQGDYALDDARLGWFSPARADSLTGLAPAFISVGGLDLFLDEDFDYARRLSAAGVPVELHSYPGAMHAFNMVETAAVAQQFSRDMMAGMARLLKGKTSGD
jgi:acetyl esterase